MNKVSCTTSTDFDKVNKELKSKLISIPDAQETGTTVFQQEKNFKTPKGVSTMVASPQNNSTKYLTSKNFQPSPQGVDNFQKLTNFQEHTTQIKIKDKENLTKSQAPIEQLPGKGKGKNLNDFDPMPMMI